MFKVFFSAIKECNPGREGIFKIRGGDGVGMLRYLLEMDARNRRRKERGLVRER